MGGNQLKIKCYCRWCEKGLCFCSLLKNLPIQNCGQHNRKVIGDRTRVRARVRSVLVRPTTPSTASKPLLSHVTSVRHRTAPRRPAGA
jgi:hypothetical protein